MVECECSGGINVVACRQDKRYWTSVGYNGCANSSKFSLEEAKGLLFIGGPIGRCHVKDDDGVARCGEGSDHDY